MAKSDSRSRYVLVESLYQRAIDLPPGSRAKFLAEQCGHDRELCTEVEDLLHHHESADEEFLTNPVHALAMPAESRMLPGRIGNYEIVRKIGEGGMGVVYEARQQRPHRTVALKVVRAYSPSDDLLKRFMHECHVLGRLEHAGIARVYEADIAEVTTSSGEFIRRPYLVMEYIEGKRFDHHLQELRPARRQRLELVMQLCDAVQYAHVKGVIHRDLKPANILVDAANQLRILDFGVARVIDPEAKFMTTLTDAGHLVGTLAYMSPDQVLGDPLAIDTRSDVYSLGVLMFEALCGQLPLDVACQSLPEAARIIRDEEPRPITMFDQSLRGDLATICTKALEKDASRRYQSAGELGEDIQRFLQGEPIDARRDSATYLLRKSVHRYRWPLVAVVIAFVLCGLFAIYAAYQAAEYRQLARREAAASAQARKSAELAASEGQKADTVKVFLQDMLAAADPERPGGRNVTVREVLDDASARLADDLLAQQPAVEAEVRTTIAHTYFNLGLYRAAIPHYKWVSDYHRDNEESKPEDRIASLCRLGRAYVESTTPGPALPLFQKALEQTMEVLGPNHELTLTATNGFGEALIRLHREREAESYQMAALGAVQECFGDEHELFVRSSLNLGRVYISEKRHREAERLLVTALESSDRLHGPDSRVSIRIRWLLASEIYARTDRIVDAVHMLKQALEHARTGLGPEHTETLIVLTRLSHVLVADGRAEEAEALLRDAIADFTVVKAVEGNDTIKVVAELAAVISGRGRHEEAESLLRDAIEKVEGRTDSDPRVILDLMNGLADSVARRGDFQSAASIDRETIESAEAHFGQDSHYVAREYARLARHLDGLVALQTGPVSECLDAHRMALQLFRGSRGDMHNDTNEAAIALALAHVRQGNLDDAEEILRQRLALLEPQTDPTDTPIIRLVNYLAYTLWHAGRELGAAELCRQKASEFEQLENPNHYRIGSWYYRYGISLELHEDCEGAIAAFHRAIEEFDYAARPQSVAVVEASLAEALAASGRVEKAVFFAKRAVPVLRSYLGDEHTYTWNAARIEALTRMDAGHLEEAETALREVLLRFERLPLTLADRQWEVARTKYTLGICLTHLRRFEEAERELLESLALLGSSSGPKHAYNRRIKRAIEQLYGAWGSHP